MDNKIHTLLLPILLASLLPPLRAHEEYETIFTISVARYAVSQDGNALYLATTGGDVNRYNYTDKFDTPTFTYSTSHSSSIRTIASSKGEKYVATGSLDFTVEVREAYTQAKVCTLQHYNQLRAVVFDTNDYEVLYAVAVDDLIRKWNVSDCSLIAEKSVGYSVHCMAINKAGTFLVYGTYEGHVGYIDTALTTAVTYTSAHSFTVWNIFFTNDAYYVSFGQDSVGILWNGGSIISSYTAVVVNRIRECSLYVRHMYNSSMYLAGCYDEVATIKLLKITNTTI